MKQPRALRTGFPAQFVAASTSGSVAPICFTAANVTVPTADSILEAADGHRPLLLAFRLAIEGAAAEPEVVENRAPPIVLGRGPVEAVGAHSCVLTIRFTVAAEHRVEARAASGHERRVRGRAVALRESTPLVVGRQSPAGAERRASGLRRRPGVQAAVLAAVRVRVRIAIRIVD